MKQTIDVVLPLVETVVYRSHLLDRKVYYSVIEPQPLREVAGKRSVLYLLHGLFGSYQNWAANTDILKYAREQKFIIVCPDAGDGWYTDNPATPNHLFESYILNEIIPDAEKRFDCGGERKKRAIAGISMGGYGAFKFAFRRPEMFCFAASMSGAFHAAEIGDDERRQEAVPSIKAVFGEDKDLRSRNSLLKMAADDSNRDDLPAFYFDCGTGDDFIEVNENFSRLLSEQSISHDFMRKPGGHDWAYWDANLQNIIQIAGKHI
ncbi:MAG TPA: alpha/beta hydrolase family protein [Pyrinomonadaceae bacterium]|nr:alpha/beta hydrolase family protein [Pyrinomonadaceae bacterium]